MSRHGRIMSKQPVRVHIFNQAYTLLADGDPREVQQVAEEIDTLMNSIASRTTAADAGRVAVLACLHLADKLHETERRLQAFQQRSGKLASLLEETLSVQRS